MKDLSSGLLQIFFVLLLALSISSSFSGEEEIESSVVVEDSYLLSEDGTIFIFNSEEFELQGSGSELMSSDEMSGDYFSGGSGEEEPANEIFEGSSTTLPTLDAFMSKSIETPPETTTETQLLFVDLKSEGCSSFEFGCCLNSTIPAHSLSGMGCCLTSPRGCCPDFETPKPQFGDCHCSNTVGGCCLDGISYAALGCRCTETEFGCCPDQYTRALGPFFEGCSCHTFPYGCCEDGVTPDDGDKSCASISGSCKLSEFGCCPDGETVATGRNLEGCTCESSEFGCCPDGKTEAKGSGFEGCSSTPGDICHMKKDPGACRSYNITRQWYFDVNYGGCSRFWFGGCGGNGNRFEDRKTCESTCVNPSGALKCYLPRVAGPASCTSNEARYYFDTQSQECREFTYNGCLGNSNRFESLRECQAECMKAVKRPRAEDPCRQAVEPGPCNGYFPLWYFDEAHGECSKFIYGGCKGNKNKFLSKEACQNSCKHMFHTLKVKNRCRQPKMELIMHPKDCVDPTSLTPKWYFDESLHSCVPLYFSRENSYPQCGSILIQEGQANETLFDSLSDCAAVCPNIYAPILSIQTHEVVVKEDETAFLVVQLTANPPPTISWSLNGSKVSSNPRISVDPSSGSLSIHPALTSDSGNWTLSVTNGIGRGSTASIRLLVNPMDSPIMVRIHQTGENPYQIGSNIKLSCEVSGFPIPLVNWYKNNARLPNSGRVRWSKETRELIIENANLIDNGYYTCRAWNFMESSHDSRNIQVEKSQNKIECVDQPWLARCELIVRGKFCLKDPSYFQICCHSCTSAGLIYNP